MSEQIILNTHNVNALRTKAGGFTNSTLRAIGLDPRSLQKGWVSRIVGTCIPMDNYRMAEMERDLFDSKKERNRREAMEVAKHKLEQSGAVENPTYSKVAIYEKTQRVPKEDKIALFNSFEWQGLRQIMLRVHKSTCQRCGAKAPHVVLHVDHIVPSSLPVISTGSSA